MISVLIPIGGKLLLRNAMIGWGYRMNRTEMILALLEGKKITREHWSTGMYIEFVGYFRCTFEGVEYGFKDRPDFGWEVYDEPK